MLRHTMPSVLALILALAALPSAGADSVPELLKLVPDGANSIAVLRVRDLMHSPRGVQQGWAEKHEQEYLDGAVPLPPWVETMVRVSYVRPGMHGGGWTAVLLPLPDEIKLEHIAQREQSEVQQIGNHRAVLSHRYNGYFAELKAPAGGMPGVLGGMAPATRQDVMRWLTNLAVITPMGAPRLSPYLQDAAGDATAQIVLAADMQEMLDPVQIRYRLSGSEALQESPQARAALTIDFQSLRSVRLVVRVREESSAEVRLDFGRDIGEEGTHIKALLVELLSDIGLMLDEIEQASVRVAGRSVTLNFPLSDESLRRVLSLTTAPPPPAHPSQPQVAEAPPQSPQQPAVDKAASLRYFKAVNRNIDDLQAAYRRAKDYGRTANWHDNFAQRVESLPTVGVDPDLVDYGLKISSMFRALGASLRGTAIKVDALNKSVYYQVSAQPVYYSGADWWWGGAWGPYGPYTYGRPLQVQVHTNLPEVRAKQAEIVAETAPDRQSVWQMISDERARVQRLMVGRYGAEFQR